MSANSWDEAQLYIMETLKSILANQKEESRTSDMFRDQIKHEIDSIKSDLVAHRETTGKQFAERDKEWSEFKGKWYAYASILGCVFGLLGGWVLSWLTRK